MADNRENENRDGENLKDPNEVGISEDEKQARLDAQEQQRKGHPQDPNRV